MLWSRSGKRAPPRPKTPWREQGKPWGCHPKGQEKEGRGKEVSQGQSVSRGGEDRQEVTLGAGRVKRKASWQEQAQARRASGVSAED